MSEFSRFGDYVLLRKLDENALGETYRAGRVDGSGALNDVVLLRLFNGAGLDADGLAAGMRPSAEAGAGAGLPAQHTAGASAGIAFLAYEYRAGKNLAALIRRANDGFSSLSVEHALLVAERVAKGLAWLHREHGSAHGCLVPQLIHVSEEGETQLHGYELAPALAVQGATVNELRAYLSPEVMGGAVPAPRDDVFSLGSLLLELLTGTPMRAEEGVSARLQRAQLIESEHAIPSALQSLIVDSLAPPAARLSDAKTWHERLGAWMVEAGMRSTNFDLAFFVQELFRDELKREVDEREDERRRLLAPAPIVTPAEATVATAAPPAPTERTGSNDLATRPDHLATMPIAVDDHVLVTPDPPPEASGSRAGRWLALVAALAVLALAAWFLLPQFTGQTDGGAGATGASVAATPPPIAVDPATGVGIPQAGTEGVALADGETVATDDEGGSRAISLDAASEDLATLIQERAEALEARLASEYDQEIAAMRAQLEAAQKVEADARAALASAAAAAATPPAGDATKPPATAATAAVTTEPVPKAPDDAAATVVTSPPADVASETRADGGAAAGVPAAGVPAAGAPAAVTPDATGSAAVTAPIAAPATADAPLEATSEAAIQVPTTVAPQLIDPPVARYPAAARKARRSATVVVKVLVGRDGRVLDADRVSDKMVGYGFDQAAINAARQAVYRPATVGGKPIEQWTTLVIRFEP